MSGDYKIEYTASHHRQLPHSKHNTVLTTCTYCAIAIVLKSLILQ